MEILHRYPYLWGCILAAVILSVAALLLPGARRIAFFSGILHAPSGAFAFTFGAYFAPRRLGGGVVGIEDFLFNYSSGLAVWLLVALWPLGRSLQVDWDLLPAILRRAALFALLAPQAYFVLWFLGLNPMTSLLSALGVCGCFVLARRGFLWPLALPAMITYPALHWFATAFAFAVWSDLPVKWNQDHFWGMSLPMQAPLGEVAWAAVFGACWPLVVAFLLDARPGPHRSGA